MSETLILIIMWMAGIMLGTIFFGGLWWTVRKGILSEHPSLWFLGSLILRMSIIIAGFYFLSHGNWKRLLPIVLGFLTARYMVTRIIGKPDRQTNSTSKGIRHASQS